MNAGLNDESNLSVTCQIDSAGVLVYSDRQDLALVQSLATREVTFKNWRTFDEKSYRFSFFTTRLTNDENIFNDTLRAEARVSNLMDDFEAGFGKWTSTTGWGLLQGRAHTGKFNMDDSPQGVYDNNVNSAVVYNFSFDLSRLNAVHLVFWSSYNFQSNDLGYVEASADGGNTWAQLGEGFTGRRLTWRQDLRSLTQFCGPGFSEVRIRFRLVTDASGTAPGWSVDDIEIHPTEVPTAVAEQPSQGLPTEYALLGNYPNPFNPETTIEYQLPRPGRVQVAIYNLAGQLIRTLFDAQQPAGRFKLNWEGKDDFGNSVASGEYLYQLHAGDFSMTKKMILVR